MFSYFIVHDRPRRAERKTLFCCKDYQAWWRWISVCIDLGIGQFTIMINMSLYTNLQRFSYEWEMYGAGLLFYLTIYSYFKKRLKGERQFAISDGIWWGKITIKFWQVKFMKIHTMNEPYYLPSKIFAIWCRHCLGVKRNFLLFHSSSWLCNHYFTSSTFFEILAVYLDVSAWYY